MMVLEHSNLEPVGYQALIERYDLSVIPHFRSSYIVQRGRASAKKEGRYEIHCYPKGYLPADPKDPLEQLEFALKYDGINLTIIYQLLKTIPAHDVAHFIANKPTSKYRRKIWFLYEFLMEDRLDLLDAKNTPYIELLEPGQYYVAKSIKSKRHAIKNNLLGNKQFCPIVRRTQVLTAYEEKHLGKVAKELIQVVDPAVLARATSYLYTKETKSSFGIEHIKPSRKHMEKFINLLEGAGEILKLDKQLLINLQNSIIDEAYKDTDYRETQNYVGELTYLYKHKIHYIPPKPDDIHQVMSGYINFENTIFESGIHPVIVAAILSFGFVFLHPFEDGNGRIHRFLIHYVLSKTNFTPNDIIFPVSAIMLKDMKRYDEELEAFSKPLLLAIDKYELNDDGELKVYDDTQWHYRYIDYTQFAEYLFECIEATINKDFKEEIAFIKNYDKTKSAIQHIIDMPDIKIDRIIRCITQNNGKLGSKMRRTYFHELSDEKNKKIEKVVAKWGNGAKI